MAVENRENVRKGAGLPLCSLCSTRLKNREELDVEIGRTWRRMVRGYGHGERGGRGEWSAEVGFQLSPQDPRNMRSAELIFDSSVSSAMNML